MATELVLDGSRITSLETFCDEVSRVLVPEAEWGRSLDALDDILWGGFGTPEWPYIIRWCGSGLSAQHLGYAETVRYLERKLSRCHPSNRDRITVELGRARRGEGATIFDRLVEVIESHSVAKDGQPMITLYLD